MTFFLSLDLLNVRLYNMNKYKTQQDDVNDFWGENLATERNTKFLSFRKYYDGWIAKCLIIVNFLIVT